MVGTGVVVVVVGTGVVVVVVGTGVVVVVIVVVVGTGVVVVVVGTGVVVVVVGTIVQSSSESLLEGEVFPAGQSMHASGISVTVPASTKRRPLEFARYVY